MATVNPSHIVSVADISPETIADIVAHIEASTKFEHFVYREAELDAVWSLAGFLLRNEKAAAKRGSIFALLQAALEAHDLIGHSRAREAAERLRTFGRNLLNPAVH